jgi:hypothetical protein
MNNTETRAILIEHRRHKRKTNKTERQTKIQNTKMMSNRDPAKHWG